MTALFRCFCCRRWPVVVDLPRTEVVLCEDCQRRHDEDKALEIAEREAS